MMSRGWKKVLIALQKYKSMMNRMLRKVLIAPQKYKSMMKWRNHLSFPPSIKQYMMLILQFWLSCYLCPPPPLLHLHQQR
jgi:hypothetical protein